MANKSFIFQNQDNRNNSDKENSGIDERHSQECYTSPEVLEHLWSANGFKPFDLDPCSPYKAERAPTFPFCENHYTAEDDGLKSPWFGRVFVNPPFNDIGAWIRKAFQSVQDGNTEAVVLFVPIRKEVSWHLRWLHRERLPAIEFNKGIKFRREVNGRLEFYKGPFRELMQFIFMGNAGPYLDYFSSLSRRDLPVRKTINGIWPDERFEVGHAKLSKFNPVVSLAPTLIETDNANFEADDGYFKSPLFANDRTRAAIRNRWVERLTAALVAGDPKPAECNYKTDKLGYVTHINGRRIW